MPVPPRFCPIRWLLPVLLGVLLLAGTARPAAAWWNGDWAYRMKVTADNGAQGANVSQPIGRTQILVRLHSGNFNFTTVKDDGSDLRVIAGDDRTPLKFHIEKFDGLVDQVGLLWVDVPDLAPGVATSFYIYWGNKNAPNGADTKATYDPDQVLVYHFNDDNGLPKDATGYANNALTAGRRDDGMVGPGLRLDGRTPIQIPASPSLAITAAQPRTISLWIRAGDGVRSGILFATKDGPNGLTFGLDQGALYAQVDTPSGPVRTAPGTALPAEGWHHVALIATADHLTVYADGEARGDVAVALPAMNGPSTLGGPVSAPAAAPSAPPAVGPVGTPDPIGATAPATPDANAAPAGFAGVIDEVEISKVARPVGALQEAVHSQGPTPNLLAFAQPEEGSAFGNGYLGIILKSVTPDAWVVICILGFMALVSWAVMVGKAFYVNSAGGANRRFRVAFRRAAAKAQEAGYGFAEITRGEHRALRKAPMLRLYDVATRELKERVDAGRLLPSGLLSPQSLSAIRSAIDSTLAQESQRLNRLMVLLTIAISGGPFLGLLGTVVGVMITFAAIAQAGDVNVNAIAPGISAALLATVAGLAVAIPALFGYNYFVTRIRDVTVDMTSFVDELVTRMGETPQVPVSAPPTRMAAE